MTQEIAEEWISNLGEKIEKIYQTEGGAVTQPGDAKSQNSKLTSVWLQNQMLTFTPIYSCHSTR